jgi:hypothetical protein
MDGRSAVFKTVCGLRESKVVETQDHLVSNTAIPRILIPNQTFKEPIAVALRVHRG